MCFIAREGKGALAICNNSADTDSPGTFLCPASVRCHYSMNNGCFSTYVLLLLAVRSKRSLQSFTQDAR
jgi:hypothetical protein